MDQKRIKNLGIIGLVFSSFFTVQPSFAEMTESGAVNIGSVLAAGILCEKYQHIERGQTIRLMNFMQREVPSHIWLKLNEGYQKGLKDKVLYSKNHNRWVGYKLTKEFCLEDVQFALDVFNQRAFPGE